MLALATAARAADAPASVAAPSVIRQVANPQIESWRATLLAKHNDHPGCYKAHYPDTGWTTVPCIPTRAMNTVPPAVRTGRAMVPRPSITGAHSDEVGR